MTGWTGACKACGCKLAWAISTSGAHSPIELAVSDEGNVLLLSPKGLGGLLAVVLSKDALELARAKGMPLHLSHFSTCPEREKFKKAK